MKSLGMRVWVVMVAAGLVFYACGGGGGEEIQGGDDLITDETVAGADLENDAGAGADLEDDAEETPLPALPYAIVGTDQGVCYDAATCMACAGDGEAFYGQDAQYLGLVPSYVVSDDGRTVHDAVTGLTWQQSTDTNDDGEIRATDKLSWTDAQARPAALNAMKFGGYDDWRLPTIKELYSLILFSGVDPSGYEGTDTSGLVPFIDDLTFDYAYGDTAAGERIIDSQYASSNLYVSQTAGEGPGTLFGVNFADGRIKGYGLSMMGQDKTFFVQCVRGDDYGVNDFEDLGDGTIMDHATGLTWQQGDAAEGMIWEDALRECEELSLAGHDDWRLPDVKELHSLVDYSRSPGTTDSPALDPIFDATPITNEAGQEDWAAYWSSTTHSNWSAGHEGANGAYVAFGRSMGYMNETWVDVHGAGAQRSDPKVGDPADYPTGFGPQGDSIRIFNQVRCVRGGEVVKVSGGDCPDPAEPTEPVCGDGVCGAGEDETCPEDCEVEEPMGPTSCTEEADCLAPGACPTEAAKGCTCADTPDGSFCIPLCDSDADCPAPPGMVMTCAMGGICVPSGR